MTALERAKQFVQSRAARTALTIMPLALATVVSVSVKAHADSLPVFGTPTPQWVTHPSNTGAYLVLGCPPQNGNGFCPDPSSSSVPYGTGGVNGYGSTGGQEVQGGGTSELDFVMTGTGSGQFAGNGVVAAWNFNIACDATCQANEITPDPNNPGQTLDYFQYTVFVNINGEGPYPFDGGTFYAGGPQSGSFVVPVTPGETLGSWSAEIDIFWNAGDNNETANFDVTQLSLNPVPEPCTAVLALAGIPLLFRLGSRAKLRK